MSWHNDGKKYACVGHTYPPERDARFTFEASGENPDDLDSISITLSMIDGNRLRPELGAALADHVDTLFGLARATSRKAEVLECIRTMCDANIRTGSRLGYVHAGRNDNGYEVSFDRRPTCSNASFDGEWWGCP